MEQFAEKQSHDLDFNVTKYKYTLNEKESFFKLQ